MTQYTGTLNAFITNNWTTPKTLTECENPAGELTYATNEMLGTPGWTKVGTAQITVTLDSETEIVVGMVEAIDRQIQDTYAAAESKINLLKEKRSQLLAITLES